MGGGHQAPLNIAIIGAGIGGLTAALELRERGHTVTLFEQSRFANEYGAAIHLAPNANGLLRRLGIDLADDGGVPTTTICEGKQDGSISKVIPIGKGAAMWQNGWLFCHRRTLHERLKKEALSERRAGQPVTLRTSARVKNVVTTDARIELEDGETFRADVVLGADGVHSTVRKVLHDGVKAGGSGKNAYRFLLRKADVKEAAPEAYELVKEPGQLIQWYGLDRRIVSFPADYNEWLNIVCMHPEELSDGSGDEWSRVGDKARMLEVYKNFDPKLQALLNCAPADSLKVWKLLDLAPLPHWVDGRAALLGDAAHPFLPYNGQGGCCAIEDAASLGVMLGTGTSAAEVPERLRLYEQARMARAHQLQDFSRQAGLDLKPGAMDMVGHTMAKLAAFAYGHDEHHYSTQQLREHQWGQTAGGLLWRSPVGFGPAPGPRQTTSGAPQPDVATSPFYSVAVRFKTSRTLLQNMLPRRDVLAFAAPGTVAEATWKFQRNARVGWLGGRPYSHLSLYLHGVKCASPDGGEQLVGDFLALMLEDRADPVVTGRDELGFPKLMCDMVCKRSDGDGGEGSGPISIDASWHGSPFLSIKVDGAQSVDPNAPPPPPKKAAWGSAPAPHAGTLIHRYVPAVGQRDKADADYIVCVPPLEGADKPSVDKLWRTGRAEIAWPAADESQLPTLHYIVDRLRELPVFGIVDVTVTEGKGVSDHKHIRRVF